jgi:hypothetical protein
VIFSVERLLPDGKPLSPAKVVALDPNHKNFAYAVGTDGKATEIQNPYFLKPLDKRLDQLKSKRDKCKKRSKLITRADGSQFWLLSRRWLMLKCAPPRGVSETARTDEAVPLHRGQSALSRLRCGRHRGLRPTRRGHYAKNAPRHE